MPCMNRRVPKDISFIMDIDFIKMVAHRSIQYRGYVFHIIATDAVPGLRRAQSEDMIWFDQMPHHIIMNPAKDQNGIVENHPMFFRCCTIQIIT